MVINILSSTQQTTGVNMKKLTLNKKEHDYLLINNPKFLEDKNIVIDNSSKNIVVEKTKRFLIGDDKTINFKSLERVA
jgi:CRISPR/Cas system CMR-associated protein Cmr3 (group 5 of RAMP superfamily)